MKKLFIITTLISFLTSSLAVAKNNNQISFFVISSKVRNEYKDATGTRAPSLNSKSDSTSFALSYGYKLELPNKFFVTPSVFYDYINNQALERFGSNADFREEVNYRYGLKADLGYNLLEKLSAYGSIGVASTDYTIKWNNVPSLRKNDNDISLVYGGGLSYNVKDDLALNVEYNIQSLEMEAILGEGYDTDINMLKIGVSHKF